MSDYIRKITDEFCDEMGFERSQDSVGVVDNGEKQPKSILSKVKREVYSGQLDYSLSKLNDLSRCALIVNSYSEIPGILQNLSKVYPELVGHVSRHSTGYIGIHLNFKIDNIPIEVQISTSDAWLVKQASEHVYKRHRDFESEIPTRIRMIQSEKDELLRSKMIDDFKIKFRNYKNDYECINDLFFKLHKTTDLYDNLPMIETLFLSYEIRQGENIKKYFDYDKILEQRLTDDNGIVDEVLVLNNSLNITPITREVQHHLVSNVEKVFKNLDNNKSVELSDMQKFVYALREFYISSIHKELEKSGDVNYWDSYQNFIMKNINKSIIKTTLLIDREFYENNSIGNTLKLNRDIIENAGCIVDVKGFVEQLKLQVEKNLELEKFANGEDKCFL